MSCTGVNKGQVIGKGLGLQDKTNTTGNWMGRQKPKFRGHGKVTEGKTQGQPEQRKGLQGNKTKKDQPK